jgi:pimeloyl-ACP methyl ester carboxylesterase
MVPSTFIEVKRLGLTANGKLDRNALPEPNETRPKLPGELVAPRDDVERLLAKIFQEVLGVDRVGIQDRFFDLGGHSLLAVRVIGRIEVEFSRKLRVATIFQAQTVEELAAILRREVDETTITEASSIVAIQPEGTRPPLFLVHGAGGGMFWGYINLAKYLGSDQPVFGFRSRGLEGREELPAIEAIAAAYVQDLRKMRPQGPYYLGGYCFGGNVAYEMARQLRTQGQEVALLVLLNCSPPNSRYTRIQPNLGWAARFCKNSWYWVQYMRQWTPRQRQEFFNWKIQRLAKRLRRWGGRALEDEAAVAVGDLVDLSAFPPEERRVWESTSAR